MARPARWRAALFAAVLPPLALGFFASALANRLVFAGWGVAAAVATVPAVRRAFEDRRRRPAWTVTAAVLGVTAPALALFGWLVGRHREVLDLGGRAVLGGLHAPAAAAPATWYALAALAVAGALVCHRRAAAAGRARTNGTNEETERCPESD